MESTTALRIDLPFLDLKDRRVIECKECYIELYDTYISYKIVGKYEVLSEDTGIWEERLANFRWTRRRSGLVDVAMLKDSEYNMWHLGIEFMHTTDGCGWYFENPNEALRVYNKLRDYMIDKI